MRGVWCALHSEAASVIRSRLEDTKFHHMKRGPSSGSPPMSMIRAGVSASTGTVSPAGSTAIA